MLFDSHKCARARKKRDENGALDLTADLEKKFAPSS